MADATAAVRALAAPLAEAAGVELVDVDVRGGGGRRLVRIRVDRKGGVTVADLQRLSGQLSQALDAQDPIEGRYSLEVTSPGTAHPLSGQRDFDRVEGRTVLVQRALGEGKVGQTTGVVRRAEPEAVILDVGGRQERIAYSEMVKATQTLPW